MPGVDIKGRANSTVRQQLSAFAARSIKFPVIPKKFPVTAAKIPCSVELGIWLQDFELARRLDVEIAAEVRNLRNSLLISLLAGNLVRRRVRS